MSSPTKAYLSTKYLQSMSAHKNEKTKQSPLELLAQTCSSIGKDCSMTASIPFMKTSTDMAKSASSSSLSNSDKSFSSKKHSLSSKSRLLLKTKTSSSLSINEPSILPNYVSPLIDPSFPYIRSPVDYLPSEEHWHSTICSIHGCLQCETVRHFLLNSMYLCECKICNPRFYSNEQLIEHIHNSPQPRKMSNHYRFHPYLKSTTNRISINDQIPGFYPPSSMASSMNHIIQCLNTNPNFHK